MRKFVFAAAIAALAAPSAAAMDAGDCAVTLTDTWTATDGGATVTTYLFEDGVVVNTSSDPQGRSHTGYGGWLAEAGPTQESCKLVVVLGRALKSLVVTFPDPGHITIDGNSASRADAPPPPPWKPPS